MLFSKIADTFAALESTSSRLEMTEANLVISSENTQSSESTIRDADMAKEITEFTKDNVLMQASQSMLAQANQSSSNILSLLQ
jgi:flagellin